MPMMAVVIAEKCGLRIVSAERPIRRVRARGAQGCGRKCRVLENRRPSRLLDPRACGFRQALVASALVRAVQSAFVRAVQSSSVRAVQIGSCGFTGPCCDRTLAFVDLVLSKAIVGDSGPRVHRRVPADLSWRRCAVPVQLPRGPRDRCLSRSADVSVLGNGGTRLSSMRCRARSGEIPLRRRITRSRRGKARCCVRSGCRETRRCGEVRRRRGHVRCRCGKVRRRCGRACHHRRRSTSLRRRRRRFGYCKQGQAKRSHYCAVHRAPRHGPSLRKILVEFQTPRRRFCSCAAECELNARLRFRVNERGETDVANP